MNLRQQVRQFWYKNEPGWFRAGNYKVSRYDIEERGGPSPHLDSCPICQQNEWLSRMLELPVWDDHTCYYNGAGKDRAYKQGDDDWTSWHQDFDYAIGVNPMLPAPKIAVVFPFGYVPFGQIYRFTSAIGACDQWAINIKRWLARTGMVEYVGPEVDYDCYDIAIIINGNMKPDFRKPTIPTILYCHDLVPNLILDARTDPDVVLTPIPTEWQKLRFTNSEMVMYWQGASQFFTRPNLDGPKRWDILAVGCTHLKTYEPRIEIAHIVDNLTGFKAGVSNNVGHFQVGCLGPNRTPGKTVEDIGNTAYHYLNRWSELLGSARFVIFGGLIGGYEMVLAKHYECLGSGAIPILPHAHDLNQLGVQPWVHYIPLEEVQNNLPELLSAYAKHKHIAEAAVEWHKENVDRMMFYEMEQLIRRLTGYKYPERLVVSG